MHSRIVFHLSSICAALVLACTAAAQPSASVSGAVVDAADDVALAGANVVLLEADSNEMITGAATDGEGQFSITGLEPGRYVLSIRFVGYQEERIAFVLDTGSALTFDVALRSVGFDLNTVIVTASRKAEKVLDAPASISVLDVDEIESNVVPSSAAILRTTTGVDMAQTGIDRYEIVLRGFNNAFSGVTYVLTDYRQGAIASLGVNAYQLMPITQTDLERVEVVRGPGSALYGAGVDAGVVHFITKDPFSFPGTTISVGGGERSLFMGSLRHAGVVNDRIGYKLVGNFTRAEEWHFDPEDRLDSLQLASFRPEALPVDYENWKYNLSGTLAYRFSPTTTLTANGGFSSSKSIFLSGIGTLQSDGFGYTFGQLRLQSGNFFAQAYVNANDAGDSFVYRSTAVEEVVDNSILFNTQAQYDLSLADDRLRLTVGADYEHTKPDTERTINGRNEDDDTIIEAGAYAQGTAALTPKLDATVALRADYNNVVDEMQASPRAALVYKVTPQHSLRATFNRAFSSPGTNSLFLDINAGSAGPLTIRARGAKQGYSFQRDPNGDLIASSLISDLFGSNVRVGMPLGFVYGEVYETVASIPTAQLQAIFREHGLELTEQETAEVVALLSPEGGTQVGGVSESDLGFLNLTSLTIDRTSDDVIDIRPLRPTVSQTLEIGYKGLFASRVLFAVDAYYVRKRNFVGPLLVETPFVLAPNHGAVISDLQAAMAAGIAGNDPLRTQLEQLGFSSEMLAALLASLASDGLEASLPAAGSPIGIVQPNENAIPGQLLLTYRNFGDVEYFGVDVSTQVAVNSRLDVFGNASWVNDNFFAGEEIGPPGTPELSMNAPRFKVKAGMDYSVPRGLRFGAALRHIDGFRIRSGPYEGDLPAYTLLDVNAGYDLSSWTPGLRLDVTVLNALNERHREFIGAPRLGRLAMARLTYTM